MVIEILFENILGADRDEGQSLEISQTHTGIQTHTLMVVI